MSHSSPIPKEDRIYCPSYRLELEPYEGQLVEVSGRVKEFRPHPRKEHLETVLLVNLIITPLPFGESFPLTHLWFLRRHLKRIDPLLLEQGKRIRFVGSVYAYFRLGGKSKMRGLKGTHDFSILPIGQ